MEESVLGAAVRPQRQGGGADASGEILLKYVKQVDELLARAEEEFSALAGEVRGELRIAASMTIAQFALPRSWANLFASIRACKWRLKLEDGGCDVPPGEQRAELGLIEGPAHTRDVTVEPWIKDELVMAVPTSHEWDKAHAIEIAELERRGC